MREQLDVMKDRHKQESRKIRLFEQLIVFGFSIFTGGSILQIATNIIERNFLLNVDLFWLSLIDTVSQSAIPMGIISIFFGFYFGIFDLYKSMRKAVDNRIVFAQSIDVERQGKPEEIREKQILLLNEYYKQGLSESYISFYFSILSAVVGFSMILISLFRLTILNEGIQGAEIVQIIGGTIISAVSGLFFNLSNKAKEVMVNFSDKLRIDNKFNESMKLIEKISDPMIKDKIQALLVLNFAGVEVDSIQFTKILNDLEFKSNQNDSQE